MWCAWLHLGVVSNPAC